VPGKRHFSGEAVRRCDHLGPGNSYSSVQLKDDQTVSLLQVRLIELNLPIKVKVGTLS
jgi:hypothetical protein